MTSYFRVHPNISIARVGTSAEFHLAPETAAGEIVDQATGMFGGLPIKPGTEDMPIDASSFRDTEQKVKRQAARFRLFAYDTPQTKFPSEDSGREVKIGDCVGGKTIADIIWTVHLANKKNNNYAIVSKNAEGKKGEYGILAYTEGPLPPIRNLDRGPNMDDLIRRKQLVIDAGPRALAASSNGSETLEFDGTPPASYADASGTIQLQPNYPQSFPDDHFDMFNPLGEISTLGQMTIEAGTGRVIVAGGYGLASAIRDSKGNPPNLCDPIDNDGWFDDTSDGPVRATIVFEGKDKPVEAVPGWVVCADPDFAPQTRNIVSTWDDIYTTWIQELNLVPDMCENGNFNADYTAAFDMDVLPVFHGAFLQRWNTNLPVKAIKGHEYMKAIEPSDDPKAKLPNFKQLIRNPNKHEEDFENGKMPLSLGDATKSYLSISPTQYFLLNQWFDGKFSATGTQLGDGEKLDKVAMENCLGGRYSPGIDLTFIVRDVHFYNPSWTGETGPFRINIQTLDYSTATKDEPFLQVGYIPNQTAPVEPGDLCKFMSQPWHTDYNSCATHTPDPNKPDGNNVLYWSWPAQRPVNVYPKSQCTYNSSNGTWNLGGQLYSVRGNEGVGTHSLYPQQQGRYQCYFDFVENWHKLGFVIQGLQIPADQGDNYGADKFLEVQSLFDTDGDMVQPWAQASEPGYTKPKVCGPKGSPPCPPAED
jgi:hypothetical protein